MLEEDTVWSVYIYNFFNGSAGIVQITVGENIIIGGNSYKTVFFDGTSTSCLLREENGIVFRYHPDEDVETIMYDFTLEIGDTFTFPHVTWPFLEFCTMQGQYFSGPYQWEVTNVYTEFIAGADRKVIELDYWSDCGVTATWIEGIGSSLGFEPVGDEIDLMCSYLLCYEREGNVTLFNGASSCELGVPDNDFNTSVLYPNPIHDQATLYIQPELINSDLVMYDLQGHLVYRDRVDREVFSFDLSFFASGMYLYQIRKKGEVADSGKFVVR